MDIEKKLGFDRIREMLVEMSTNTMAAEMARQTQFSARKEWIERELTLTEEMRQIVMFEPSFPTQDYIDMSETLDALRVENRAIELEQLFALKLSLRTIHSVIRFLTGESGEKYPAMREAASRISVDAGLLKAIDKIVDDRGEMYDNASEHLLEVRRGMERKRGEVDSQVARALARAKREGWAPENGEATIRNGRPVIPMLDTHRRKIKGIIHDESATRQTAFVEPTEVVELNNELNELTFEERREIQRILMRCSDSIRPQIETLREAYWFLARTDYVRSKARLALELHAGKPILTDEAKIDWLEARHPLLVRQRSSEGKRREVVPFDLRLNSESRMLIISGPNAGGKSVLLKAVGLIQYMLQCGLLVPCRETSEFGIFGDLFIDIGDEQSIDNDLSTYTSHLKNMKELLGMAGEKTLFLLDELGGGTEPRSGCAIAEAMLEELYRRGSYGVVTTHYADLKLLADRYAGISNGAMLFDTEQMRPLYRLRIGNPGSSFAFEIAANVGFPEALLRAAGEKVGGAMLNFEHQLQQLEVDREEVARQRKELEMADDFLAEVTEKYQKLTERLESRRHDILTEARNEARAILTEANQTIEQTITEIRKAQAEKETTARARAQVEAEAERLAAAQERHDEERSEARKKLKKSVIESVDAEARKKETHQEEEIWSDEPLGVGSIVSIDGERTYGEIVEMKGKKAVVESNSVRMTIAVERLRGTRKKSIPVDKTKDRNNRFQSIYDDINEKRKTFNPTLDIRGMRAEEALTALEHFMDDAQLLSEHELRILHGKGYGILKQIVRDRLHTMPEVRKVHAERLELGGEGITVVEI